MVLQSVQQKEPCIYQCHVVPFDWVNIMLADQHGHQVVYDIVLLHAVPQPSVPLLLAWEIHVRVSKLPLSKFSSKRVLVRSDDSPEAGVCASEVGHVAAVAKGEPFHDFKENLGRELGGFDQSH